MLPCKHYVTDKHNAQESDIAAAREPGAPPISRDSLGNSYSSEMILRQLQWKTHTSDRRMGQKKVLSKWT